MDGVDPQQMTRGTMAAAISNAVVSVVSSYIGRGPTKARAHVTDDLVSVVLRDLLTRGERILADDGRHDVVLRLREAFSKAMRNELVAVVEGFTGRKVEGFFSDQQLDPDMAVMTFVMQGGDDLVTTVSDDGDCPG